MHSYNGFTPAQRMAGDKIIKKAIEDGILPSLKVATCKWCGQSKGILHYHCEDYSPENILNDTICLCWTCHLMWHNRFRFPEEVQKYMDAVHGGKRFSPVYINDLKILEKYGVVR